MAERCYKDPYLLKPGTAGRGVARVFQEHPQIADTSALTTTLEFAKNPCGLPRGSGAPLDGISDPAGYAFLTLQVFPHIVTGGGTSSLGSYCVLVKSGSLIYRSLHSHYATNLQHNCMTMKQHAEHELCRC